MTTQTSRAVVSGLVDAGLLDPARSAEAETVVQGALREGPVSSAPLRRRLAEIAGYVGGAFVVGAAWLFFSATWDDLGRAGQVSLLLVSAAVLVAGGLLLARAERRAGADPLDSIRGRLAAVLLTGGAACTAFGAGIWLDGVLGNGELVVVLAALAGVLVAVGGYLAVPSPVGQLGIAVGTFVMIPSGLAALHSDSQSAIPLGLLVLLLGGVWLGLAERGVWRDRTTARVIGCVIAFVGAQIPVADEQAWVAYLATAGLGAAAFGLYVGTRSWPYLATGVIAVTVAVPEALYDWAGGSLGAAGILLATGVTLLVASLAGLRLRQEVTG